MQRRIAVALVLLILAATPAIAQQHPVKEKGFNPERLYDLRGIPCPDQPDKSTTARETPLGGSR